MNLCSGSCFSCFGFPWFYYRRGHCFLLDLFFCWVLFFLFEERRATSPGSKPSLFVFFCPFFCCFSLFVFVFGGFKGQVRWQEGPPHLALNPPYYFCGLFCVLEGQKTYSPPEEGYSPLFLNVSLFLFAAFC